MRHVALIAVTLAALAGQASADGFYYSESVGGTKFGKQFGTEIGDAGLRIHLALGWRWKNWAAQGFIAIDGDDGEYDADGSYHQSPGLFSYGLDLKYLHPISQHLEVYLRGSASRGSLMDSERVDYSGRGLGVGAGVQLKGKVPALGLLFWPLFFIPKVPGPKITGALFVDDGFEFYRLHPGGKLDATPAIDGTLSHITFGFALGKDF